MVVERKNYIMNGKGKMELTTEYVKYEQFNN